MFPYHHIFLVAGLWLEDLDTFAADVAARHVGLHDKTLFTAYVDWCGQKM